MKANIADLKGHLSDYIQKVEKGEELVVCRHNKPVAKILPWIARENAPLHPRAKLLGSLTGEICVTGEWDGVSSLFTEDELDQIG